MSRFPIIDSPCPFRFASRPEPGRDHCDHCDRQVHNLDGMSSAQREVFMRSCDGTKVCVAYTVQRQAVRRNVSLGIGLAASMIGSAAMADGLVSDTTANASGQVSTASASEPDYKVLEAVEFVGGVNNPGEARWADEAEISPASSEALPEIAEMDWLPSKTSP